MGGGWRLAAGSSGGGAGGEAGDMRKRQYAGAGERTKRRGAGRGGVAMRSRANSVGGDRRPGAAIPAAAERRGAQRRPEGGRARRSRSVISSEANEWAPAKQCGLMRRRAGLSTSLARRRPDARRPDKPATGPDE